MNTLRRTDFADAGVAVELRENVNYWVVTINTADGSPIGKTFCRNDREAANEIFAEIVENLRSCCK